MTGEPRAGAPGAAPTGSRARSGEPAAERPAQHPEDRAHVTGDPPLDRTPMTEDEIRQAWVVEPPRLDGQMKRELAARRWAHVQNHADAKTAVVESIIAKAMAARDA